MPELAFFCWVYLQQPGHPCIRGEWLPRSTIVLGNSGGYTSEDENLNPPPRRHRARR